MSENIEKKYAYSTDEAVRWLLDSNHVMGGFYSMGSEAVDLSVAQMRNAGWSKDKILKKTTRLYDYNYGILVVPLTQIIYSHHPIIHEWTDKEKRLALFSIAMQGIAEARIEQFDPKTPYAVESGKNRVHILETFADKLSQVATASQDIRNK